MGGSLRGSQNFEISSGSPPEWGGALGGAMGEFISGQDRYQIDPKISSCVARKTAEMFLFTLRNTRNFVRVSRAKNTEISSIHLPTECGDFYIFTKVNL